MAAAAAAAGGDVVNSRAATRLVPGVLMIGLLGGMTMGCGNDEKDNAAGPGPTKVVAGVPVGYERSRAGAIRAALGYEGALVSLGSTTERWQDSVEAMAVPSRRQGIVEAMTPGLELISKNVGREGFVRGAVLGFRVKAYDRDAAEIDLWEVSVLGRPGTIPPQSGWTTTTLRLRWANDDWKLTEAPDGNDGPTPQLGASPSEPAELFSVAESFEEVRNAPMR